MFVPSASRGREKGGEGRVPNPREGWHEDGEYHGTSQDSRAPTRIVANDIHDY